MENKNKENGLSNSINSQSHRHEISFDLNEWFVEADFIYTDPPERNSGNKELKKNKSSLKKKHNVLSLIFIFILAAFVIAFFLWDYGYINIPCFTNLNNNYYEGDDESDLINDELDLAIGDTIEFGSFPQTQVYEEDLINELNECDIEWSYFDVYSGKNEMESMQNGDFMLYSDVVYNGEKYRAVKFSQYRPRYTYYDTDSNNSEQYSNGYRVGNVYWFKYEPLKWRIISESGLAICETVVSSEAYNNVVYRCDENANGEFDVNEHFIDDFGDIAANDFFNSSLVEWLDEHFFQSAFNEEEKQIIIDSDYWSDQFVSLLSQTDMYDDYDDADMLFKDGKVSDYAKCMGLCVAENYFCFWMSDEHDYFDCGVVMNDQGDICYGDNEVGYNHVYDTGIGVRPVICLG